jgi:hypothetical protein
MLYDESILNIAHDQLFPPATCGRCSGRSLAHRTLRLHLGDPPERCPALHGDRFPRRDDARRRRQQFPFL